MNVKNWSLLLHLVVDYFTDFCLFVLNVLKDNDCRLFLWTVFWSGEFLRILCFHFQWCFWRNFVSWEGFHNWILGLRTSLADLIETSFNQNWLPILVFVFGTELSNREALRTCDDICDKKWKDFTRRNHFPKSCPLWLKSQLLSLVC